MDSVCLFVTLNACCMSSDMCLWTPHAENMNREYHDCDRIAIAS